MNKDDIQNSRKIKRNNKLSIIVFTLLSVIVLVLICNYVKPIKNSLSYVTQLNDSPISIIHSYGTAGLLEPCGCSAKQVGGFPQRAFQIKQIQKDTPTLILEGGYLVKSGNLLDQQKFKTAIDMMNKIGYQALALGKSELLLPSNVLKEGSIKAKFPFLSANVFVKDNQEPLYSNQEDLVSSAITKVITTNPTLNTWLQGKTHKLFAEPAIVVKTGNIRIGVTAITSSKDQAAYDDHFIIYPPEYTLRAIVKELKKHCDFVVVMAEGEHQELKEIADNLTEIDLLLTGDYQTRSLTYPILKRYVKKWINNNEEGYAISSIQIIKKLSGFDVYPYKISTPSENFDKEVSDIYDMEFRSNLKKLFEYQTFSGDYKFLTEQSCDECHKKAFKVFSTSKHSKSFNSLKIKKSEFNPECMSCHATYETKEGGMRSLTCQSCHSNINQDHIDDSKKGVMPKKPTIPPVFSEEWCATRCHNPQNSTQFASKYQEYVKKFNHGLDEKTRLGKGYVKTKIIK